MKTYTYLVTWSDGTHTSEEIEETNESNAECILQERNAARGKRGYPTGYRLVSVS